VKFYTNANGCYIADLFDRIENMLFFYTSAGRSMVRSSCARHGNKAAICDVGYTLINSKITYGLIAAIVSSGPASPLNLSF